MGPGRLELPPPPICFCAYVRTCPEIKHLEKEILKKRGKTPLKSHKLRLAASLGTGGQGWAGYSRPVEQHEQEGADDEGLQHLPVPAQGGQPGHEELARHRHEARHHRDREPFPGGAQLDSWNTGGTRETSVPGPASGEPRGRGARPARLPTRRGRQDAVSRLRCSCLERDAPRLRRPRSESWWKSNWTQPGPEPGGVCASHAAPTPSAPQAPLSSPGAGPGTLPTSAQGEGTSVRRLPPPHHPSLCPSTPGTWSSRPAAHAWEQARPAAPSLSSEQDRNQTVEQTGSVGRPRQAPPGILRALRPLPAPL